MVKPHPARKSDRIAESVQYGDASTCFLAKIPYEIIIGAGGGISARIYPLYIISELAGFHIRDKTAPLTLC
jgi:hypothetical protein